MSYLADLAGGLRAAAGVLNPDIQKQNADEDQRNALLRAQQAQTLVSTLAKQVADGVITPDAAVQATTSRGLSVPKELFGGPSVETQARIQTLANERGFRDEITRLGPQADPLALANVATKYGKPELAIQMYKNVEDQKFRLQKQADDLDMKRTAIETQREIALSRLQNDKDRLAMDERFKEARLALDRQMAEVRSQQTAMQSQMLEFRLSQAAAKEDSETSKKVTALGTAFEKANLPVTTTVLSAAEKAVSEGSVLEYINGPKSALPDFAVSKDAREARQAIQKLFNITLKDRSGAAVTSQELERLKAEFGQGKFKTPDQLRTAVREARSIVDNHYKSIAASYGPKALKVYNENLKAVGGVPVLEIGNDPGSILEKADAIIKG